MTLIELNNERTKIRKNKIRSLTIVGTTIKKKNPEKVATEHRNRSLQLMRNMYFDDIDSTKRAIGVLRKPA